MTSSFSSYLSRSPLRSASGCFRPDNSPQWADNKIPRCSPWRIAVNQKRDTSFTRRSSWLDSRHCRAIPGGRVSAHQPIDHVNDFSHTSVGLAIMIAKCVTGAPLEIYTPEIAIRNNGMIDAASTRRRRYTRSRREKERKKKNPRDDFSSAKIARIIRDRLKKEGGFDNSRLGSANRSGNLITQPNLDALRWTLNLRWILTETLSVTSRQKLRVRLKFAGDNYALIFQRSPYIASR